MRPSIAGVVVPAFFALAFLVTPSMQGQINGAPTSVTSPGFGGRPINGPRSSVTSPGPQGWTPARPGWDGNGVHHGDGHHGDGHHGNGNQGDGHHNRDNRGQNYGDVGPVWYAVPVPYATDNGAVEEQPEPGDDDANYQGGPTVFDRRGQGERSYMPPVKNPAPAHAADNAEPDPPAVDPDPPLPATVLVFKDGHTSEVANYAIQGATLFDLTTGHRRKIAIADLDLEATRRQNEEHGVTFDLPRSTRVN